jgi:sugar O-acyltransferase (sialic acid O-acetyltransferase NeuD family)
MKDASVSVGFNKGEKSLFVFGASGHAKVVIDIIEKSETHKLEFLADDNPSLKDSVFFGYRVIGDRLSLLEKNGTLAASEYIVAIGNNSTRSEISDWLQKNGMQLCASFIHPSAQIGRGVKIGNGSVVMAGAVINSDASIGCNVIVNTGVTIDHDCVIGDSAHIAPGATLCGNVGIGNLAFVGAGAVIIPNLRIGKNVTIGAGSCVLADVAEDETVVGSPARSL